MEHPLRWPWARQTARAVISEAGGCACSLLSDQADWNAETWAMRPEILERLASTLQVLVEEGPPNLSVQALWFGETPGETVRVTAARLVALARASGLGTRTRYELSRGDAGEQTAFNNTQS